MTKEYSFDNSHLIKNKNLKIKYENNLLRIKNSDFGRLITPNGGVFQAEEIQFHSPAEHKINGKSFDLEVQIIHSGISKGDIAKQVVLSFLFEKKPGIENLFINDIDVFNLPNALNKEIDLTNPIFIPKLFYEFNPEDGKPEEVETMPDFSFYTYQGSLTSPPCSEDTVLYVVSKPLHIGTTALQLIREAVKLPDMQTESLDVVVSDSDYHTQRKLQPLNGRPIFYYDYEKHCPIQLIPQKQKPKEHGHFEKIQTKKTEYIYVNGDKPSGLPNAFVVSKKEALDSSALS